ncbi:hypothetical protein, partial [Eubacterium callanderi]|uniref:hypothetical protein n=1 Tax=Eubacterium callanderi TaxID=53442 RepID=UPI00210A803B
AFFILSAISCTIACFASIFGIFFSAPPYDVNFSHIKSSLHAGEESLYHHVYNARVSSASAGYLNCSPCCLWMNVL